MATVLHPRLPPRRGGARATTWWGKAWVRATEEAAYAESDLATGRSLARAGRVGQIAVEPGRYVASVEDARGLWTVEGAVPVLDDSAAAALVETVAAEAGRVAALMAGDLPHELVEQAEEAGAELLPDGHDLSSTCGCRHWVDPCAHALAVLAQLAWLLDADPFVLLGLRGLPREELLARLHARQQGSHPGDPGDPGDPEEADLDLALEAALYAGRLIDEEPAPPAPSG